jgi:hypothetical protein
MKGDSPGGMRSWLRNGDVLFPVGYELNFCYVEESRPPLWSSAQSSWLHNGDVLCSLWGTNRICYVEESGPPLWSNGQEFLAAERRCIASCEVRTEFVMLVKVNCLCDLTGESRLPLWSDGQVRVLGCITEIYCFLWGTNWIYVCCVEASRPTLWCSGPPLWSIGQSSWLQITGPGPISSTTRYSEK